MKREQLKFESRFDGAVFVARAGHLDYIAYKSADGRHRAIVTVRRPCKDPRVDDLFVGSDMLSCIEACLRHFESL